MLKTFLALHAKNTQRAYSQTFEQFGENLLDATLDDVTEFLARKRSDGCADNTIRRHAAALSAFYGYLVARGYRKCNPLTALRYVFPLRQKQQVRPTATITWQQVRRLFSLVNANTPEGVRDHAILACLFAGGLRRSELLALNCGDVVASPDGATLRLLRTKSGVSQEQVLPRWAAVSVGRLIIQRHHDGAQNGSALFVSSHGSGGERLSEKSLYRWFRGWCGAIGVRAAPHAARAAAITRLHEIGVDMLGLVKFARHSDTQMIMAYVKKYSDKASQPGKELEISE